MTAFWRLILVGAGALCLVAANATAAGAMGGTNHCLPSALSSSACEETAS